MVLIDSGSTHNFLDSSVCKKTNVSVCTDQRIKVNIANGGELISEGKYTDVRVQLQEFFFLNEAYVM